MRWVTSGSIIAPAICGYWQEPPATNPVKEREGAPSLFPRCSCPFFIILPLFFLATLSDNEISIILEVPFSKPGQTDTGSCTSNKSKLKVPKSEAGLLIDLNPYCNESYGPDEVNIALYWISIKKKPIVEIGTNGPACVPVMLYIYNKDKRKYELAAEQCGG